MKKWLVIYQLNNNGSDKYARVETESYGGALDKAMKIIDFLNDNYKKQDINLVFHLKEIHNIDSMEDWSNDNQC